MLAVAGLVARRRGRAARSDRPERDAERPVERLDHSLRAEEASLGDPGDVPAAPPAAPPPSAGRRARSRTERSARPRRSGSARPTRAGRAGGRSAAPPSRSCTGSSSASLAVLGGHERPRVRLGEAGADEHVLDLRRRRRCSCVSAPDIARRAGQRRRHLLDPEAHDLLDEVDRARDVAACATSAPSRWSPSTSKPSRCSRSTLLLDGNLEPGQRVGALRPVADDGPGSAARRGRRCARSSARRRARRAARSRRPPPARPRTGRRPSPSASSASVRSRSRSRRPQHPERLEVRRLEQDVRRLVADLGLLAAHDPGDRDRPLARRR